MRDYYIKRRMHFIVMFLLVFLVCIISSVISLKSNDKANNELEFIHYGEEWNCYININYMKSDSVTLSLTIFTSGEPRVIKFVCNGKKDKNNTTMSLKDECNNFNYPVNCYIVKNDSLSFKLFVSEWKDRVYLIDQTNYFMKKYPQFVIKFTKTFRRYF